jgi:hypothetical protein
VLHICPVQQSCNKLDVEIDIKMTKVKREAILKRQPVPASFVFVVEQLEILGSAAGCQITM